MSLTAHQIIVTALNKANLCRTQFKRNSPLTGDLQIEQPVVANLPQGTYHLTKIDLAAGKRHQMLISLALVVGDVQRKQALARLQNERALILIGQIQVSRVEADAEMIKETASHYNVYGYDIYIGTMDVTNVIEGELHGERSETDMSEFSSWGVPGSLTLKPEITAPGGNIWSVNGMTDDEYELMSGTSMAAPTVSGIAALLRSAYPDREAYSTKFIQSQIVNTGTINLEATKINLLRF